MNVVIILLFIFQTGTGSYAAPLPTPSVPKLMGKGDPSVSKTYIHDMQKKVTDAFSRNKEAYNLFITVSICSGSSG